MKESYATILRLGDGESMPASTNFLRVAEGIQCNILHVQIAIPRVGTWTMTLHEWDGDGNLYDQSFNALGHLEYVGRV